MTLLDQQIDAHQRQVDEDDAADLAEDARREALRQQFDAALDKHGEFIAHPFTSLTDLAWDALGSLPDADGHAFLAAALHALHRQADKDSTRALDMIFQHACELTKGD